jgi:hypothetical protein
VTEPDDELELAVGVLDELSVLVVVVALCAACCSVVSLAAVIATTPVRPNAPASIPMLARLTSRFPARRRLEGE